MKKAKKIKEVPTVIIAKTTKGKGVNFMQNSCTWHGRVPTEDECKEAICQINLSIKEKIHD